MKLAAAALVALAFPASTVAALEVKLSVVPTKPTAGAASTVQLRPYWTYNRPDGSCCLLKPAAVNYPLRVEAVSPAGRVFRVRVRRTKSRYVWSGAFRVRAAGRWVIPRATMGPAPQPDYGAKPRITLTVGR